MLKKFLDKPWTWRTYFKACGVLTIIYILIFAGWYVVTKFKALFKYSEDKDDFDEFD